MVEMLVKCFLKRMGIQRQASFMKKHGLLLATRQRDGRSIYIYMFRNLFAEIIFVKDNPGCKAERVKLFSGLERLSVHLDKDLRP